MSDDRPYHHGNLRTALLAAAERGLRERGADELALRDLAREIGVSHAAPRRHFPTRQALLDALAEDGFARLDSVLLTALEGTGGTAAHVRAVMTAYVRFATENAALADLMYTSKHRPGAERLLEAAAAPFGRMRELVLRGQSEGVLRGGDPDRLGMVLIATLQGLASMVNSAIAEPEQLGDLLETAFAQFVL
ncbi:TetR/AcrR family transcriptional regulator [Lentzea cavernae]|uniref:TetR/AcrR family transcriptional regulator n=1 Tax=Lentzea cavernae TaxID=2020703 RepID=UPI001E4EA096|nr:TetR/AcrR family transcriptional regulator [Lentzea cavernae]